jgi:Flp pilus assembly pilin Flp
MVFVVHCTLLRCRRGASSAEYALILGLICTAIVGGLSLLGTAIAAPISAAAVELTP